MCAIFGFLDYGRKFLTKCIAEKVYQGSRGKC